MSLYNVASRVNAVEIGLRSKASRNNPTFTGAVSFAGATVTGLTALNDKQDKLSSSTDVTAGVGTFKYIACTATSGRPITPSGYGAYLGCDGTNYCALELSCDLMSYIDFTSPGVDYKGRFQFLNASTTFQWFTGARNIMSLSPTGLVVNGTTVSSSDKRLKFNEKQLTNALDVINRLEPCEYQQSQEIVERLTPDTPQSHQCGFIAQQVQQIEELRHAVVGGEIGDDGQ